MRAAQLALAKSASAAVVVVEGASLLPLPLVAVEAVVRSTGPPALPGTSMVEVDEGVVGETCRGDVGRN